MFRICLAVLCLFVTAAAPASLSAGDKIKVGSLVLTRCIAQFDGYCGSIVRRLDPAGRVPGEIRIGFEFYPHSDAGHARRGVIIAQEGGPGYSTTGSRDGYVPLFAPLRKDRDILLIDKRGTGRSGAIDCPDIESRGDLAAIRACGRKLGRAAWLYGSTFAADDIAAILTALDIDKVDYYGDSYGTYFGQIFATRHPDRIRTMVLDSAYPVIGDSPFFETEIENGPAAFAVVCARSPSCRGLGGSEKKRFEALVDELRKNPISGPAPGAAGEMKNVTADVGALFAIIANAGNNFTAYRDIDAAGRAWREAHDSVPLLRLVAEAIDGVELGGPADEYSEGLALAVQCTDYGQLYDMRGDEVTRREQYQPSLDRAAANNPHMYAPFRLEEAIHAVANPTGLNLCQAWPAAPDWARPGMPVRKGTKFPDLPVLVLSGELDTVTSPKEGQWTAALFPDAKYLDVPNTVHEAAIGNGGVHAPPFGGDLSRCTSLIVLNFVESGGRLSNTSCLAHIRPVRTVPAFALHWRDVAPAAAQQGNAADRTRLELASAAAETVGDAVARYGVMSGDIDRGLRGGTYTLSPMENGYAFDLKEMKWTDDLAVSGRVVWNQLTGQIMARIRLSAKDHDGQIQISWSDRDSSSTVFIRGRIDGKTIVASRVAP